MMNTDILIRALDDNTEQWLMGIAQFTQDQLNTVPFAGSWTAGQVVEHIYKGEVGIPGILRGPVQPTQRDPMETIPQIEGIFLDFNTKFNAPKEVLPTDEPKDKEAYINRFVSIRKEMRAIAHASDLSETCADAPFPTIGLLTRYEWLWFVKCHAERHTRQLNNIYRKLM